MRKHFSKPFKYLAVAFAITLLSSLIWFASGQRSVPYLSSFISNKISALLPQSTNLFLDDVQLGFSQGKPVIFLKQAVIRDTNMGEIRFAEVSFTLNFTGLIPFTDQSLFNVQFPMPEFALKKDANKKPGQLVSDIKTYIKAHEHELIKYNFTLKNNSFVVPISQDKNVNIDINQINVKPITLNKNLALALSGEIALAGKPNSFHAVLFLQGDRLFAEGSLSNITNDFLGSLDIATDIFSGAEIKADLNLKTNINNNAELGDIEFLVHNVEGHIKANGYFTHDLTPQHVKISGACKEFCTDIVVDKLHIKAEDVEMSGNLKILRKPISTNVSGNINIGSAPIDLIKLYWPENALKTSREWVYQNINGGQATKATANFDIDLEAKELAKDAVAIDIDIEGTTVTYMPSVPAITGVNGHVTIKNDDIHFKASNGTIKNTNIVFAEGSLLDLSKDNTMLFINAHADGSVQDLIDVSFAHAEVARHKYNNIEGHAATRLTLKMPITDEKLEIDDIDLSVDAKITKFAGQKLYDGFGITNGEFNATYKNAIVKADGKALLNGKMPVGINFKHSIKSKEQSTAVKAKLNWNEVEKLGFKKPPFVSNQVDIEYIIQEDKAVLGRTINLDLKNSLVAIKSLGITKKVGTPGNIKLVLDDKAENNISDYHINLPNFESRGQGSASKELTNINSIISYNTKLGNSDFSFTLANKNNQISVEIEGDSLDLGFLNLMDSNASQDALLDNFKVKADVKKIYLRDGIVMTEPVFYLNCHAKKCKEVALKGIVGNNQTLSINLDYPKLKVNASDAGSLIKGFGISEKIGSGSLAIDAKYEGNNLSGTMVMSDFKLLKAPILARLMTLTSLTVAVFDSIGNIAGGEGIKFDKAVCPFVYGGDIIKINTCEAAGPTMLLSGTGSINLKKGTLNIAGTIASKNIINSTLGKIPLLGKAITGSDEKGLFGANYSISGPIDDAQVNANPLSILTPGIFRQIFSNTPKSDEQ